IGLMLDQLLGAAMQQPDMRIDAFDHLTVELEHETEHAVGGRMLRPEIDCELPVVGGTLAAVCFGVLCIDLRHHASTLLVAFARLAATPRLKGVQETMKRS